MTLGQRSRQSVALVVVASLGVLLIALPLVAVLVRIPWSSAWSGITSHSALTALRISLETSIPAALISTILGVPMAWLLARSSSRVGSAMRAVVLVPMVLPPVVGGIALLTALGRRGVFGRFLYDWFGWSLPFTRTAVVVAQIFVALPFLILSVEAAFRQMDHRTVDAARTLGAGPLRLFSQVALPAVWPAVGAGALLAWARALGEFGASITFAGSFPGRTQTLPMAVYAQLEVDYRQCLVLSLLMIALSIAVIASMRHRWFGVSR